MIETIGEQQYETQGTGSTSVLESVKIEGLLRGLACELTVTQAFRNDTKKNIEAVYTFPLPHGATLLDLVAKIGDRELRGTVLPKAKAEERYEEAISEGDGAIMLEKSDDGICTVNFGNLMPGAMATLTYRYAYLLSWQQDAVKFRLPTTIAPRYGDYVAAGYQPHQVPVTDFLAEYPFILKLEIEGVLSGAMLDSPSHRITVQHQSGKALISLQGNQAWMDRDFILDMRLAGTEKAHAQSAKDEISGGQVVLASFCPQIPGGEIGSICAKIVIDCSGSMSGDSIAQARIGLHRILDNLRETDTFNVIRFGSTHRAYFPECAPAKGRSLRSAREAVDNLDADLGGTEMGSALDFTYALPDSGERPAAILLITDGGISNHREVIRKAVKSGHRIFTVGVGSAVTEEFVRGIAAKTGGACELVSPNEGMADAIYRQFRRMFQHRAVETFVDWPSKVEWQSPGEIGPVFAGDTLHLFAGMGNEQDGPVRLRMKLEDGREVVQEIGVQNADTLWSALPRVAAASRIEDLDKERPALAEELANRYQLVTKHTNFLILDVREEEKKAEDMPDLVKVSQMLAAGWGATGSVREPADMLYSTSRSQVMFSRNGADVFPPAFLRKQVDDVRPASKLRMPSASEKFRNFINGFAQDDFEEEVDQVAEMRKIIGHMVSKDYGFSLMIKNLGPLLPEELYEVLSRLANEGGWLEDEALASLLLALVRDLGLESELGNFCKVLEASSSRGLVSYFTDGLKVRSRGAEWKSSYELLPFKLEYA